MTDRQNGPRYIRTMGLTFLAVLAGAFTLALARDGGGVMTNRLVWGSQMVVQGVRTVVGAVAGLFYEDHESDTSAPSLVVVPPVQAEPRGISAEDLAAIEAGPVFTPMTVRPEITNRSEGQAALMTEHPAALRDSGIGGRAVVWFYISDEGRVLATQIFESSGYEELDQAALKVAAVFQFTPAMNPRQVQNPVPLSHAVIRIREAPVAVWIHIPITFAVP